MSPALSTKPRRVTLAEVACEAGVSQQTVSRVLNNKNEISETTRQRVLEVIERLHFHPSRTARGLASHKTLGIGLIVADITNPFFPPIARGAEDVARTAGYSLLLCNTNEDPAREADALRTLNSEMVDGIVLCGSRLSPGDVGALLAGSPPAVLVNRNYTGIGVGCVRADDAGGAMTQVRHLLNSGRRKIGFLSGPAASHSGRERVRGCAAGLEAAGLALDPALAVACHPSVDGGRKAAAALLSGHPDLDALYCYNDLVAVGALQTCARLGRRVPEDVAVVGCDDILLADMVVPALTTLRVDKEEIGKRAMHMMLLHLSGASDYERDVVIQPELVIRASAP
jgi:LacI family transcriptional regulator